MAPDSFDRLRPHLRPVALKRRAILQEHNHPVQHVYFIERGVASIFARTQRDGPVEVGIVGRLGFVGVAAVLGTMRSPNRCLMEVSGEAFSVATPDLQRAMEDTPKVRQHLLNYVHALLIQHTQTALCNVRHELDERLCRWLLLASDRLDESSIPLTHDQLSMILGVRRASVTVALLDLEHLGAVTKARGAIEIADRAILQNKACECYRIIASEYQHIAYSGSYEHVFLGSPLGAPGPGRPKSKFLDAARFDQE
jgi:CRP-like cAMP-binding protein